MEILFYYCIAALSFAMMYSIQYGYEITKTVLDVLVLFDIEYKEERWNLWEYNISLFFFVILTAPIFLFVVLTTPKYDTIKLASGHILEKYYGLKKEE